MQGWVKVHREIIQEPFYKNEKMLKLWLTLWLSAAHEEHDALVGIHTIHLKAGQLIFGLDRFSKELQIERSTLYRHLKALEKMDVIAIDARRNFSIITLREWGVWHQGEKHLRNTDETPARPYNKGKNEKKDKKEYIGEAQKISFAEFVLMTAEQHADLVARYGEENTAAMIDLLNSHKGASGKTYKDDYFAIRNWCVKAVLEQKEAPTLKSGKRNKFINYTDEHTDFSDVEAQALRRRQAKTSSA